MKGIRNHPAFSSIIFLLLISATCAAFPSGLHADQSLERTLKAAQSGDANAQFELGFRLYVDEQGDSHPEEGIKWLEQSARNGNDYALCVLAFKYWLGELSDSPDRMHGAIDELLPKTEEEWEAAKVQSEQDWAEMLAGRMPTRDEATRWHRTNMGMYVNRQVEKGLALYREAAARGNDVAQAKLGYIYSAGYDVERDYAESRRWLEKAAAQGNSHALFNLARLYYYGYGVKVDKYQVARLLEQNAASGDIMVERIKAGTEAPKALAEDLSTMTEFGGMEEDVRLYYEYMAVIGSFSRKNEVRDAAVQFLIASMYLSSEQTRVRGLALLKKSAAQGYAPAEQRLAQVLANWRGPRPPEVEEAERSGESAKYYQKAAVQGDAISIRATAARYYRGDGGKPDYPEALRWYLALAEKGDSWSQLMVGTIHAGGKGTPVDRVEAMKWFRLAAKRGNYYAAAVLAARGEVDDYGKAVEDLLEMFICPTSPKPLQATEDFSRTFRAMEERGDDVVLARLMGCVYFVGNTIPGDHAEAMKWFAYGASRGDEWSAMEAAEGSRYLSRESGDLGETARWYRVAADKGNTFAESRLGDLLLTGAAGRADYPGALDLYGRAAAKGDGNALFKLGRMHADGKGVPRNPDEAMKWWKKASETEEPKIWFEYGFLFYEGIDVAQDLREARKWFEKAASYGDPDALYAVARMHARGEGVPQSLAEAYKWYYVASTHGHHSAFKETYPIAPLLSKEELDEAIRQAIDWRPIGGGAR